MISPVRSFFVGQLFVRVYASKAEMGRAAAAEATEIIRAAILRRNLARLLIGTGPSQQEVVESLAQSQGVDWHRVELFHLDEYVGMAPTHPASFRLWLKTHLADLARPGAVHYLEADAPDLERECRRYADLLAARSIDIAFLGFGENGHVAFNDPHVADFHDPLPIKRVVLDERCRMQQVGEGHFKNLEECPREAITLTCPSLFRAEHLICSVPDLRKAEAVRNALDGPVSEVCPASLVRMHPSAKLFLDMDSASLLRELTQQDF